MSHDVVVIGAGYAGVSAVEAFERASLDIDLTIISDEAHHEVKHEIHRIIRSPDLADDLAIPVETIVGPRTAFRQAHVTGIDPESQEVRLDDGGPVEYDYLLVTVGAQTAFYGIPGLEEHAVLLERVDDAVQIHEAITSLASPRVVVGGAGLSGIQAAGEIHEMDANADLTIVEALDDVMPRAPAALQRAVGTAIEERGIRVQTGASIVEATESAVQFEEEDPIPYDVLIWTGGLTGREIEIADGVERERNRFATDRQLRTSDERIFACGDAAAIEQPDGYAPASAQAAWQAAPVAARNVLADIQNRPLAEWTYNDRGTLVSVGEEAFAHDVSGVPISTFGSIPAKLLKKIVAARWIADAGSYRRAIGLWPAL